MAADTKCFLTINNINKINNTESISNNFEMF